MKELRRPASGETAEALSILHSAFSIAHRLAPRRRARQPAYDVLESQTLVLVSHKGRIAALPVKDIPQQQRVAYGNRLFELEHDDRVVASAVVR
jgi:DNA gyrase/topoisomerase IV subunit A